MPRLSVRGRRGEMTPPRVCVKNEPRPQQAPLQRLGESRMRGRGGPSVGPVLQVRVNALFPLTFLPRVEVNPGTASRSGSHWAPGFALQL